MENKEAKIAVAYCQDRKCPDQKLNIYGEKGIDRYRKDFTMKDHSKTNHST